jgi:soluble lytic murein transglycosylase-like protein
MSKLAILAAVLFMWSADLRSWHRHQPDSIRWRLTEQGIELERTTDPIPSTDPDSVARVWNLYQRQITQAATTYNLPPELLIATILTESSGRADSVRLEPGFTSDRYTPHRISVGLCQTLISTAQACLPGEQVTRDWLLKPANSIRAGACYIDQQRGRTKLDPPLVAAAYNAGSLRRNNAPGNAFKLRCYPLGSDKHIQRFVRFFNTAYVYLRRSTP